MVALLHDPHIVGHEPTSLQGPQIPFGRQHVALHVLGIVGGGGGGGVGDGLIIGEQTKVPSFAMRSYPVQHATLGKKQGAVYSQRS